MALLNRIQQKLALLKVSSTLFVHPLAEVKEELSKALHSEAVRTFEVLGVKYLIGELVTEDYPMGSTYHSYTVAIRQENTLLIGSVNLFSWEWLYLVEGHNAVNEAQYMRDTKMRTGNILFSSAAEIEQEVEKWKKIAEQDPEKACMPEYIRSIFEPVTMDENGEWHNA